MEEYEKRFLQEYQELQTRTEKLGTIVKGMEESTLTFTPKCPYWLLKKQHEVMSDYLIILETRAKIENIQL